MNRHNIQNTRKTKQNAVYTYFWACSTTGTFEEPDRTEN